MKSLSQTSPLALSLALGLAAAGCAAADASSVPAPTADATFDAGPFDVDAGGRAVMCTYVRGDNAEDEDVVAFLTQQTDGAATIVYTIDHPVDLAPEACPTGGQLGWSRLVVSQRPSETIAFPSGVGVHVKAHQQYVIETHYLNGTQSKASVQSSFAIAYGAPGSVRERAATYFFGTMNVDLAAGATAHAEASCAPPAAMTMRTMFAHSGRHTTSFKAGVARAPGDESEVYTASDGDAPTRPFPGLEIDAHDQVHVTCDWTNGDARGYRFPDEACFAVGYHWPAAAPVQCVAGGGDATCRCLEQGRDLGAGGARVAVTVRRAEGVPTGVNQSAPLYCSLYRKADWQGGMPKPGAWPAYYRDALDTTLATENDSKEIAIGDVTPGDYVVACMMDTIGGGFMLGAGDLVNTKEQPVHVAANATAAVEVVLDGAYP